MSEKPCHTAFLAYIRSSGSPWENLRKVISLATPLAMSKPPSARITDPVFLSYIMTALVSGTASFLALFSRACSLIYEAGATKSLRP